MSTIIHTMRVFIKVISQDCNPGLSTVEPVVMTGILNLPGLREVDLTSSPPSACRLPALDQGGSLGRVSGLGGEHP